jgi:hypothetical protein
MKSRQVIELNHAQIRQSIEEHLRQLDAKVLVDPYLADLKSQLMEVMVQTIGVSAIEDLVITEVRESSDAVSLEFISQGNRSQPRKMVATLRSAAPTPEESHGEEAHGEHGEHAAEDEEHADAEHAEHAEEKKPAAKPAAKESSGHGAPAKKPASGHGAAPKKADAKSAGGHGAKKEPAKKSGH